VQLPVTLEIGHPPARQARLSHLAITVRESKKCTQACQESAIKLQFKRAAN